MEILLCLGIKVKNKYSKITKKEEALFAKKMYLIRKLKISKFKKLQVHLKNTTHEKQNIVIVGDFDAGKTTIANTLLGKEILPSGFQPKTSLITVVKSKKFRPTWVRNDICIMNKEFRLENLNNELHFKNNLIICTSYKALNHLTYKNSDFVKDLEFALYAIVFYNADILDSCNIIDVPGYGYLEQEEKFGLKLNFIDVLIYVSQIRGFLTSKDFININRLLYNLFPLRNFMKKLPKLRNFFIIASHADYSINKNQIDYIFDYSSKRLAKSLSKEILSKYQFECFSDLNNKLRKRMYTYSEENNGRSKDFITDLIFLVEKIIPEIRSNCYV